MPLTIGLTGGIAAGKSTALASFERLGAATISSDAVVHELLDSEPLLSRLAERWGEDVAPDGRLDRARVGEIVFADPVQLAWLESQVHPLVGERIGRFLASLPEETEIAVVEVPLLFESGMEGVFDASVAVVTSDDVRRARAEARGHTLVGEVRYTFGPDELRPIPFKRQALHAWRLTFYHPVEQKAMTFEAPLPADLENLLADLRRR